MQQSHITGLKRISVQFPSTSLHFCSAPFGDEKCTQEIENDT